MGVKKTLAVKRARLQVYIWRVEEAGINMLKSGYSDSLKEPEIDEVLEKITGALKLLDEIPYEKT